MSVIDQHRKTQRKLRSYVLEAGLLALLAGVAAVAVWVVVIGFGVGVSPEGLPVVALGTTVASVVPGQAATGAAPSGAQQQPSTPASSSTSSLSATTVTTQAAPAQTGAGRTVVTQRLRTNSSGSGQGSGGPDSAVGKGR